MTEDKLIQLIEVVSSIGYKITKLDCQYLSSIEIFLFPAFNKKLISNNKLIELIKILSPLGFEFNEYNILCNHGNSEIKISLKSL